VGSYVFLAASNKLVYMRYKHFLVKGHRYCSRKMNKYFDHWDEVSYFAPSNKVMWKECLK
jgi:succinylglutamate desuccinylase